ncbi:hypothetical protein mRhiFer1_009560 [Rhinolophus ferrumequinum]|uniref:Uncharacterized protein n=1 Tax=Rhinolophus ferrumequinum TaxID=59479 RepID=A0A7J7ZPZ3_RHIFE|nr:hypothetical protein mRhiFer1_009560 [Rhinolophus ferrumequinum]
MNHRRLYEPYGSRQVAAGLRVSLLFAVQLQTRYWWQPSSVHNVASPTCLQAVNNHGLLCSSYQVLPGHSQAVANLGLHQTTSQKVPEPPYLEVGFRLQQSTPPVSPTRRIHKGWSQEAPEPTGANTASWAKSPAQLPISCGRGQIPQPVSLRVNTTH